jgi:hypothetical protein
VTETENSESHAYMCWHTWDKDSIDGGNNGVPVRTSANMHPILQISIAGVYCTYKSNSIGEDDRIGRCSQEICGKIN